MSTNSQEKISTSTNMDEYNEKKSSLTQLATMNDINADSLNECEGQENLIVFPEEKRKKLLRKIDIHMIPALALIYLFSYIDRANIGNAKIEGLEKDLHLTPTQYNVVLSMFFLTYIVFEIPSSYVLESWFRTRPSRWIAIIVTVWGIMMTLHAIVQNYGGILTVRLLMGMAEAGAFPASVALLSKWYTQYELAYRLAFFYLGSALSGAFSGILAYGLAKLNGVGGLAGWRWIFLVPGCATILLGFITPLILSDVPETRPSWLTEEEADYLIQRMILQNGGEEANKKGKHLSFSTLWAVVSDWQMYPLVFSQWSNTVPTYGLKFTLPTIIKNMGFTASNAQLLSIPPYIAGAISALTFNYLSDKFRRRAVFLLIPQSILIVAYILLTVLAPDIKDHIGPCFFAIILANIGCYPINPATSSWCSNNTSGVAKRSIAIAYMISLSSVGGIFSSYIFVQSEAPGYPAGFGTSLGFAAAGAIAVIFLDFNYSRINKKRDRMTEEEIRSKYTQEQLDNLGDKSPYFRYTL